MTVSVVAPSEGFPTFDALKRRARALIEPLDYGASVTYPQLTAALGIDATSHRGRSAVLAAGRELHRETSRLLVNVRGQGYAIAKPNEHVNAAARYAKGSQRRMHRAHQVVTWVPWDMLTDAERALTVEWQTRTGLAQLVGRKLISPRTPVASSSTIAVPSGRELVRLLTKTVSS